MMRDNQQTMMIDFVNIIKRYPEIYDVSLDTYRTRFTEMAWTKVANQIKSELNEDCTLEELKAKWKGIRSSFNRYRSRMHLIENNSLCKKYYLYDHLKFLEPFLKCNHKALMKEKLETSNKESRNFVNVDGIEEENEFSADDWNHIELKPDVTVRLDNKTLDTEAASCSSDPYSDKPKKRKLSFEELNTEDDNEDLSFFKSILPDIRNFTIKEKRKLKMGILQLIDEIEKEKET